MPLGRHALRVVLANIKTLFWGYVGGRLHNNTEGFIKYDEFVSWLATIKPDSDYYWTEACTLDVFSEWLNEFVQAKESDFKILPKELQ